MPASSEDLFKPYTEFLDEARQHGFSPKGDMFEQELSLYGGDMSDTFYSRLSIRID